MEFTSVTLNASAMPKESFPVNEVNKEIIQKRRIPFDLKSSYF